MIGNIEIVESDEVPIHISADSTHGLTKAYDSSGNTYVIKTSSEGSLLKELEHPNIVKGYGVFEIPVGGEDIKLSLLEYMDGVDFTYVDDNGGYFNNGFNIENHYNLWVEITEAVLYLHQKNIIHSDIKSDNIRVLDNMRGKLFDFQGAVQSKDMITKATTFTVSNAAPEQFCFLCSKSSDIYCLMRTFTLGLFPEEAIDELANLERRKKQTCDNLDGLVSDDLDERIDLYYSKLRNDFWSLENGFWTPELVNKYLGKKINDKGLVGLIASSFHPNLHERPNIKDIYSFLTS